MSVAVSLPLFGDPGRELPPEPTARDVRELAETLRERLLGWAETLEKLHANGWTAHTGAFDLLLEHPHVRTQEDAQARLTREGLALGDFVIVEDIDEDEV